MATFELRVQVGDVVRVLTLVEHALRDPSDLMSDVLLVMIRSTQITFDVQGRPNPWDDLAESTRRRRLRKAGIDPDDAGAAVGAIQILRDSGLLFQSVGGNSSGPFSNADGFAESDELSATIGTNRPGWQNQFADTRGTRPERPFILFQDQDEEDVMAMAEDWFLRVGPYAA